MEVNNLILESEINIIPTRKNLEHYRKLGYNAQLHEQISVKNQDLPHGSKLLENRKCDDCGAILSRSHKAWEDTRLAHGLDLCPNCSRKRTIKKIEDVNLNKYGVKYPMQSKEIQEKARATSKKNWRVDYSFQNPSANKKARQAFKDKYGVDNPIQVQEFKEQAEETNLSRYNAKNVFSSDEIQEKIKNSLLKKYGVDNPSKDFKIRESAQETCKRNYGVAFPLQNEEIKEKQQATCLEKYGFENAMQNPEIKTKAATALLKANAIPTSSQQLKLFELCKDIISKFDDNADVELNVQESSAILDIRILFSNGVKIDVEYDGWYWHQDVNKDRRRDEFLKNKGYKILRIRSGKLLPTEEELKESFEYLLKENNKFSQIILKDWAN